MAAGSGFSFELSLFSLGRNIIIGTTIGFSIGIGVSAGMFVVKKILKNRGENEKVVVCMLELTKEMKELRSVIIRLDANRVVVQTTKPIKPEVSSNSLREFMSVRMSSDDEDEFFEMPRDIDEDIVSTSMNTQLTESQTESVPEDTVKSIIQEVEELSQDKTDNTKIGRIHSILERAVKKYPGDVELSWRLARAYSDLAGTRGGEDDLKKDLLYKGLAVGKKAVELDDKIANAHKWYAIMLGSTSDYESAQDQIIQGFKYKEHISKAIELNDRDASSYHLLGRWCFEVSQLSWWKRKAASALIAEPPSSTLEEALENFLKAEELDPGFWLSNTFWIAKCYYQQSEYSECKEWLQKTLAMEVKSDDDRESRQKATELLRCL